MQVPVAAGARDRSHKPPVRRGADGRPAPLRRALPRSLLRRRRARVRAVLASTVVVSLSRLDVGHRADVRRRSTSLPLPGARDRLPQRLLRARRRRLRRPPGSGSPRRLLLVLI